MRTHHCRSKCRLYRKTLRDTIIKLPQGFHLAKSCKGNTSTFRTHIMSRNSRYPLSDVKLDQISIAPEDWARYNILLINGFEHYTRYYFRFHVLKIPLRHFAQEKRHESDRQIDTNRNNVPCWSVGQMLNHGFSLAHSSGPYREGSSAKSEMLGINYFF